MDLEKGVPQSATKSPLDRPTRKEGKPSIGQFGEKVKNKFVSLFQKNGAAGLETCSPKLARGTSSIWRTTATEEAEKTLIKSAIPFHQLSNYECILFFEKNEAKGLVSVRFSYPKTDFHIDQSANEEKLEARHNEIRMPCFVTCVNHEVGWENFCFLYKDSSMRSEELGIQVCEVLWEDDDRNVGWQQVSFSYNPNDVSLKFDSYNPNDVSHKFAKPRLDLQKSKHYGTGNRQKCEITFNSNECFGWIPLRFLYWSGLDEDPLLKKLDEKRHSAWKISQELYMGYNQKYHDYPSRQICKFDGPEDLHKVRVVAIGPYHNKRQEMGELFVTTEMKWQIVTYLHKRCNFDWKSYLSEIKQNVNFLGFYQLDEFEMDKFLEMLLLDGCFLLFVFMVLGGGFLDPGRPDSFSELGNPIERQFIDYTTEKVVRKAKEIKLDLLMYDNQIPFGAIELVSCQNLMNSIGCSVKKLALLFFDDIYPPMDPKCRKGANKKQFIHLLNLFHWSRTPSIRYRGISFLPKLAGSIPSASELQGSGISFHTKGSGSALDLTFSHGLWGAFTLRGIINVPKLHITNYTKYILHTLVVFEQHRLENNMISNTGSFCTTSYLASITQLVQSKEDVKLLRHSGILANTSKTDKEVFETIQDLDLNRLSIDTKPMLKIKLADDAYELYEKIRVHHGRKWNIRYGEFKQNYCGNAWITLSVIAAIFAFLFTGLQCAYSAMSYHFPKN